MDSLSHSPIVNGKLYAKNFEKIHNQLLVSSHLYHEVNLANLLARLDLNLNHVLSIPRKFNPITVVVPDKRPTIHTLKSGN